MEDDDRKECYTQDDRNGKQVHRIYRVLWNWDISTLLRQTVHVYCLRDYE
jgi:hypothetical protein